MALGWIKCSFCNKEFLKENKYIKENNKLGHNSYCSPDCSKSAKLKQRTLICENKKCNKIFTRKRSGVSFRSFCSHSCAMEIIGPENGLKHQKLNYCKHCGARVKIPHQYCSMKCWGKACQKPKVILINSLKNFTKNLGRSPVKREFKGATTYIKYFGSWTKALSAAGLKPNRSLDQKMYKRRICFAKDGHKCNSVSELIIDNWLYYHGIQHEKEVNYPAGKFVADWRLKKGILVEYFGLAYDSKQYDQEIIKKINLCKKLSIELISIYSKDLFPKNKLNDIFAKNYSRIYLRKPKINLSLRLINST